VDTWAATSAGAMTLSENALYTVDGWRVFFEHLEPGGIITFSRWFAADTATQTYRLFSVAQAMLISQGVTHPAGHLALIKSGMVATLLASNQPFSDQDIRKLKAISGEMDFTPLVLPGETPAVPELRTIAATRNLEEMAALRHASDLDYSPTFDTSPYFFNSVHIRKLLHFIRHRSTDPNLQAILFLLTFMLAAGVLVISTIVAPAWLWVRRRSGGPRAPVGGIAYFIAIGLGFMLVEMAMMQQLSIFLGHPIYSMVVVLAGLILSSGMGSLTSDRWPVKSAWQSRLPAIVASLSVVLYFLLVLPAIHAYIAGVLWQRVLICLALVISSGFFLGFCFPVGMRWMKALSQERNLPWMWALNGAAGTLGSFLAILISMDTSIETCVLAGAACYLLAGLLMPVGAAGSPSRSEPVLSASRAVRSRYVGQVRT